MLDGVNGKLWGQETANLKSDTIKPFKSETSDISNLLSGKNKKQAETLTPEKFSELKQAIAERNAEFEEAISKLTPEEKFERAEIQKKIGSRSHNQDEVEKEVAAWNAKHPDTAIQMSYSNLLGYSFKSDSQIVLEE